MYKWIIIGGGVQGCCVATRLLENGVNKKEMLVIDTYPEPMYMWQTLTAKTGMPYLRSPSVHHLGADPFSLKKYSRHQDYARPFKGRYARPRLDMFNQHSMDEMNKVGIQRCWRQGTVKELTWSNGCWEVKTSNNQVVRGECVVLAMGVNHQAHYPEWACPYKKAATISHVFDMETPLPHEGDIVIVGGGMTAAHLAYTLSDKNTIHSVTLVKRHPFRIKDFDSDPGWLGPKNLRNYQKMNCYSERRKVIQEARHRGSITSELHVKLRKQVRNGKLTIITEEIHGAKTIDDTVELFVTNDKSISGHSLILATGAESRLPGEEWLKKTIKQWDLPCSSCGFPIVSSSLKWKRGLYVAGALAELEIGPVSRNIAGARKAAERIAYNL
ncbi:FAD/NAD(P)-binding protein [Gracilibacillus salinarum]|uniref:FAD-dependent oxidoreductase n=1 Tax=Gracilibacillus salinarum TaxID=2932255 RepID=A0ABY4GKG8_9BACI|nr:FAD/NAD(P)-binding protein [Gracilibacillus salinarum]UOQ84666.1 FAD-dependent oxidoreductase [Gracilibacillus salinarum]